jgi:transcriptional regulator with XRE-family HTH domain
MVLLRRVIGDALRSRRQAQHRTLREVSTAANVSLGYLSEIERGQKEASSELLSAICEALGARLSELLREVSSTVATVEEMDGLLAPVAAPVPAQAPERGVPAERTVASGRGVATDRAVSTMIDGDVSVTVRQDTPLKATLRATRRIELGRREPDALSVA